uniref:(northern house mosquito) hypothetical protein n=1 Tax=Culex pipiens TaxID=7175 RepID=A0A8D8AFV5_CULPI
MSPSRKVNASNFSASSLAAPNPRSSGSRTVSASRTTRTTKQPSTTGSARSRSTKPSRQTPPNSSAERSTTPVLPNPPLVSSSRSQHRRVNPRYSPSNSTTERPPRDIPSSTVAPLQVRPRRNYTGTRTIHA